MPQSIAKNGVNQSTNQSINQSNRDMKGAMDALYELQSKTTEALVQSKLTRHLVVQQMRTYLDRLSINQPAGQSINFVINQLPIVHVAGTKGKGSTCSMIDSLMQQVGLRTGLFTSPHLISINERFRLMGRSIDEETFLKHFWFVWDTLSNYKPVSQSVSQHDVPLLPSYFRFLTLVAFSLYSQLFLDGKIDVLILEVGMGGRLDSTNVINQSVNQSDEINPTTESTTEPVNQSINQSINQGIRISGITSIGYDHMEVLGYTLEEIAREKGGIIKPHSVTFTVNQSTNQSVLNTLAECAKEEPGAILSGVPSIDQSVKLGLQGDHQRENASLAVAIVKQFLTEVSNQSINQSISPKFSPSVMKTIKDTLDVWTDDQLPPLILSGLAQARWGGRCEIVRSISQSINQSSEPSNLMYFIDGAHTDQSVKVACAWFQQAINQPVSQLNAQSHTATKNEIISDDTSEIYESISQSVSQSSINQSTDQSSEYVNVLLFNTGHVRNPFELFAPIIDMGLPATNQSVNQSVDSTANQSISQSTDNHSTTQFRHFVTCPFDHDRPHISGAPSIDRLIDESAPQDIKEFVNQQRTNQSINHSTNQPVNQSINNWQHTLVKVWEIMIAHRVARLKQSPSQSINQSPKSISHSVSINQSVYPHSTHVYSHSSVALSSIARMARANPRVNYRVFVVGSLYLVGNVLEKLGVQVS